MTTNDKIRDMKHRLRALRRAILDGRAGRVSASEAQWVLAAVALFANEYEAK